MGILVSVSLILIGLGLCLFGYSRWKGKMHGSYFAYGFSKEANYMAIPGGISAMVLGTALIPIIPTILQATLIYLPMLIIIASFFVAWHIFKPDWVKWIEQNHEDIIPYLAVEIRDNGWHVQTQQELEEWIAEVRHKYQAHL